MDPSDLRGVHQVQILKKEIRQSQAQLRNFLERLCGDISTPEQIESLLCKTIQEQIATSEAAKTDEKRLTYASQTFTVTLTPEDQSRELGTRATGGYWNNYSRGVLLNVQLNGQAPETIRPGHFDLEDPLTDSTIVRDALVVIFSSGITTALYHLLRAWVDKKNGRKIRSRLEIRNST